MTAPDVTIILEGGPADGREIRVPQARAFLPVVIPHPTGSLPRLEVSDGPTSPGLPWDSHEYRPERFEAVEITLHDWLRRGWPVPEHVKNPGPTTLIRLYLRVWARHVP